MGYCKNILMVLPLCLLLNEPQVVGQRQPPPGGTTIAVDAPLVLLRAAVRDRKGGLVSGLNKDNFQVFEDRAPQTIRFVEHEDVPVAVGLVVDNSASMGRKRKGVIAAALAFARSSNPQDEMFVVNFNEHVSFGLPDTALFSARPDDLERALNGIPASGRTALYDAIEAGLSHLRKATLGKKALIVITDGGDNASHNKLGQLLEAASRADVMIYTVGIFDEGELHVSRWFSLDEYHDGHPGVLKKIAHATGGESFLSDAGSDVVPTCKRIAEEIRTQYTIGYVPTSQNFDDTYGPSASPQPGSTARDIW